VRNRVSYLEDEKGSAALYPLEDDDVRGFFFEHLKCSLRSQFRYPVPYPKSPEELNNYVRMVEENGGACFLLVDTDLEKRIGVMVLVFDWVARRCDLLDFIWCEDLQRREVLESGLGLLARYAFDGLRLVKLSRGTCDHLEIELLTTCHWTREGTLRRHCRVGSKFLDYHLFALLAGRRAILD
jgi:hypothetical protein